MLSNLTFLTDKIFVHMVYELPVSLALLNMSNLINQKDSRWLQLEVCREFQRNKCSRSDNECKFAHPTSNVEVQNGRVTACYDSIKVKIELPCNSFIILAVLSASKM